MAEIWSVKVVSLTLGHPVASRLGSKSALLTDFRKFTPEQEGRKEKENHLQ